MSLAIITGASSGLGTTFARRLARSGHDVVLVARRLDRLESLAAQLRAEYKVRAEPLVADLATDAGVAVVSDYIASTPRVDLLVNNAGFGTKGLFFEIPVDSQDQMHRLHVMATMRLCHSALQKMTAQGSGAIINVSSVAAFMVGPGNVSYCSTKAWMNAFTAGLESELRSVNSPVQVQALCPGFTITEFHDTMGMDRGAVPKRMWMSAERVVDISLLALESRQLIVIPGGLNRTMVKLFALLPDFLVRKMQQASAKRLKKAVPKQV